MKKKIIILIFLALAIRIFLMLFCLHSDIWAVSFAQYLLNYKGIFNIYDYMGQLPQEALLIKNYGRYFFTYPPLAYFSFGAFGILLKPLSDPNYLIDLVNNLEHILEIKGLYRHLFLTKLPYLFFDFGILMLLNKWLAGKKEKYIILILWLFNPFNLYTTYMIGQFDIIPVFFVILSLYLSDQKKTGLAALSLGFGTAFKMFPLFFLPFLIIKDGKSFWKTIKLTLLGIAPYILTILPFMSSVAFRQEVLFSNQSQKMLFARIPITVVEYLSVFFVAYTFLLMLNIYFKRALWVWYFGVLLILFSVTHYHPQWYIWISPFFILFLGFYKKYWYLILSLFIIWILLTLGFEPSLSIGLFSPLNVNLLHSKSLLGSINFLDMNLINSIFRSIAAGISIGILFLLLRSDEKTS